ncbi:MAG: insulinase family protein [Clostridiales bacterium]|nr:insulinase family protein [Clostridiales bacterium]
MQVLERGCKKYHNIAKINEKLDNLYSASIFPRNYIRGEAQILGFAAEILDNEYAPDGTDILSGAVEMIGELLLNPLLDESGKAFNEGYVSSEKANLIDAIRAKINNKNSYAVFRCREEMCKDEAYGISETGKVEDVLPITPASLYEYYCDILSHSKIEIYYVGKCDERVLCDKLASLFATLYRGPVREVQTLVVRTVDSVKNIVEEQPVVQGKLCLGFRSGMTLRDKNFHVFAMLNEIYGGSVSSKLFKNVREKLSLCYYCYSIPESHKGVMIVTSGIENANREISEKEILAQLDSIRTGDISEEEMENARRSLENAYLEITDSAASVESWYFSRSLAGRSESPAEFAKRLASVTREEIITAARGVVLDTVYFMLGTAKTGDEEDE